MLSELGTASLDETEFTHRKGMHTGGVRFSTYTSALPAQVEEVAAYMLLRGKAMTAKAGDLFDIFSESLHEVQLDRRERALEMLEESIVRAEASVISAGNSYAASSLSSRYSLAGHVGELQGGVSQLETMRSALAEARSDWPSLLARLESMRTAILCRDGAIINLTAEEDDMEAAAPAVDAFLGRLPSDGLPLHKWTRPRVLTPYREGLQVGTQVNYVAKAAQIYPPGELAPGSTAVVSRFLRTSYLWDKVRVQGGAYGCSLGFNRYTGLACFSSYRDPNLAKTLAAYDAAPAFLREASTNLARAELDKSIIGAVGDMDSPMSADQKGFTSMVRYLLGVTEEERQTFRSQVLTTSHDDLMRFAERLDTVATDGSVAVVGSEKAFAEEAEELQIQVRQLP